MTNEENRRLVIQLVDEAVSGGARRKRACEELGVSYTTVLRWEKSLIDKRTTAVKKPRNMLSIKEKKEIIDICSLERFVDKSPKEIVPILADEGTYLASESTMFRVLRENRMLEHREESKKRKYSKPNELKATGPNQVWSWDITYIKTAVKGIFLYLYMFMDIYSRKIVGWKVYDSENCLSAKEVLETAVLDENVPDNLCLHSDNGSPMRGSTFTMTMQRLGVIPSYSRPRCSDDNPYSEALFKTLKYVASFPGSFSSIEKTTGWVVTFVSWYNKEHRHSGIKWVTPEQRHSGLDKEILVRREKVYAKARAKNPERWIKNKIRDWSFEKVEYLNPKKIRKEKIA